MPKLTLESLFLLLMLAAGAAISTISWGYGFGSSARPGPGLYPFFVGLTIAGCALFILIDGWRSRSFGRASERAAAKRLVLMTLTFSLWILAMPLLGYVLVTFLATYAFCKIMQLEGWRKPLAVSGGTTLFIYVLFDHWLYIDLPRGLLG